MRNPPPEVVASWPPPNLTNPETQGKSFLIVATTMIILCTIIVTMRIYVRWRILHNLGTDDWLIVVSLLPAIGLTTASLMGTRYGWGMHIWDGKKDWMQKSVLVSWISQLLFVMSAVLSKLSICWSYRRLSDSKLIANILLFSKIFILVWGITFICTTLFKCWPIHIYWTDISEREHLCINENGPLMTASIINIITDFWLTLLPIPLLLWRLRLPFRQRLILTILMSLGLFACAAGIARVYYLDRTLFRTYDVTWEGYNIWLWTAVEIDLSIICCSVPPLRPLIRRHFPRILETHESFGISTITDHQNRGASFAPPSTSAHRSPRGVVTSNPNAKTHFMLANDSADFFDRKLPLTPAAADDREKQLAEIARIESSPQPYTPPPLPPNGRSSMNYGRLQRSNSNSSTLNPPPSPYTRPLYSPPPIARPRERYSGYDDMDIEEGGRGHSAEIGVAIGGGGVRDVFTRGREHARVPSAPIPLRREMSNSSSNVSYFVDNGRQVSLEGPLGEPGRGGSYWARGGGSGLAMQGIVGPGGMYIPPRSPQNREDF